MEDAADQHYAVTLPALRSVNQTDGRPYQRPAAIEVAIREAMSLPRKTLLDRAAIRKTDAPGYILSEVLVHVLRARKDENSDTFFDALYQLLVQRLEARCPAPTSGAQDGRDGTASTALFIRETVLGKFNEFIAKDRDDYCKRLDYFEIRFDGAIAALRTSAKRSIARREARTESMDVPSFSGEMDQKFEKALAAAYQERSDKSATDFFRFIVAPAIELLPEKERIVINLMLQDIQADSKDPTKPSIAKMLGLTDRAVRYRYSNAIEKLKALIAEQSAS